MRTDPLSALAVALRIVGDCSDTVATSYWLIMQLGLAHCKRTQESSQLEFSVSVSETKAEILKLQGRGSIGGSR